MDISDVFLDAFNTADVVVGFSPFDGEPDIHDFLKAQKFSGLVVTVPQNKDASPHDFAEALQRAHTDKNILVFIPGRAFDAKGTRHGRGGGWYDRFLSKVPREWVRVGVLNKTQLSEVPLKREAWDEPMDFLLIQEPARWNVFKVADH